MKNDRARKKGEKRMEDHLHGGINHQKKAIQHVIEKFQKRGIKISACKPRTMLSLSCLTIMEPAKSHES
jgi:predicted peroxiredoxin